ncbi:MAG TPA: TIGR03016 family PEP-CTERM system-associated outer membrane protein [Chromatiaceae bacterium]|jgi:uncharacterized protein (PEP-CTERM system associated)|nr:TIGR03016 family PEP-CTERM system-associated outer membrane protein [Chromatiaceae bacterium]
MAMAMVTVATTVPRKTTDDCVCDGRSMKKTIFLVPILILVLGLMFSAQLMGSSWRGDSGVTGRFIFSDNIFLSATDTQSGGIVQIFPFVSLTRGGNRVRVNFNYGPSALWYPGNTELNDIRHVLDASVRTELIERYFFLDVVAKANQVLINPEVNAGFDGIANSNAFTQTASISVTPTIILPVADGRFATVRFSPGIGAVATASTAGSGNGAQTRVEDQRLSIVSGPMFTTVPWSLSWRRRLFDSDSNQGFGQFSGRVGYIFSPRYRTDLILGYDSGDYTASDGNSRGTRWEWLFRWTPKPSSRFEIGAGQAYYGNLFSFTANHRHKRWAFRSQYRVEIQDATTSILEQQIVPLEDIFGQPIVNPITGENVVAASITTPVLIDDTFLRERLQLSVGYSKGRNSALLDWWTTRRDYNSSDIDTLDNQVRLTYTRRLSNRLSASVFARIWDYSAQQQAGFDYFQDGVDLRVSYRLGSRSSLSARIGHQRRDSEAPQGSFSENRISMDLTFRP